MLVLGVALLLEAGALSLVPSLCSVREASDCCVSSVVVAAVFGSGDRGGVKAAANRLASSSLISISLPASLSSSAAGAYVGVCDL